MTDASDRPTTAALVVIGAEILSAKIEDKNGPFLIRALRGRGVEVVEVRIIPDKIDTIVEAVTFLKDRVDFVLTTGGIGPTHDDVTVAAIAKVFGLALERHPVLESALRQKRGDRVNEGWLKMIEMPVGARVKLADGGFVPTIQVQNVIVLPGVPSLMRLCFAEIQDSLGGAAFHSQALMLQVSESAIAADLAAVQSEHPSVAIGSYPRFDDAGFRVKVTVDGRDVSAVIAAMDAVRCRMNETWIVAED